MSDKANRATLAPISHGVAGAVGEARRSRSRNTSGLRGSPRLARWLSGLVAASAAAASGAKIACSIGASREP